MNTEKVVLSKEELEVQSLFEKTYGIPYADFLRVREYFFNKGILLNDVALIKSNIRELIKVYGLGEKDIKNIFYSKLQLLIEPISKVHDRYTYMKSMFDATKDDFANLLKESYVSVFYAEDLKGIYDTLNRVYPTSKRDFISIMLNAKPKGEFKAEDIISSIMMIESFSIPYSKIHGNYGFLRMSTDALEVRLKLMFLTGETLEHFFNKGYYYGPELIGFRYIQIAKGNASKNTLFMTNRDYFKATGISFDRNKRLTTREQGFIYDEFKAKFPRINRYRFSSPKTLIQVAPEHAEIWEFISKEFGLTQKDYTEIALYSPSKLQHSIQDYIEVFEEVNQSFGIDRQTFGKMIPHEMYFLPAKLELLSIFGIDETDLSEDNFRYMSVLSQPIVSLENKLKLAFLGDSYNSEALEYLTRFNEESSYIYSRYMQKILTGYDGSLFDLELTPEQCSILQRQYPYEREKPKINKRFKEEFPTIADDLDAFYAERKDVVKLPAKLRVHHSVPFSAGQEIAKNEALRGIDHKVIGARIDRLAELGYSKIDVARHSDMLAVPRSKMTFRAMLAEIAGASHDNFLNGLFMQSETSTYARLMGADMLEGMPESYYLLENEFFALTGLSTDDLVQIFPFDEEAREYVQKYYQMVLESKPLENGKQMN